MQRDQGREARILALFVVTFVALDARDIDRKQNQDETARVLLGQTYMVVRSYVDMMETPEFEKTVRKRISGEAMLPESKAYQNLSRLPFAFEDRIFIFADNGIIPSSQIEDYIVVKQEYERYVTNRIVFYDIPEVNNVVKKKLLEALRNAETGICSNEKKG